MTNTGNIATLITIIYGLMLTDLFASVHRLLRNRHRVRWHWLPLAVAWYVLAIVLKNWWGLVFIDSSGGWESGWVFLFYGHLLFLLYLVASAVLPDDVPAGGLDLLEFYLDTRRHFWGLLAAVHLTLLVFALLRPFISGQPPNWLAAASNTVMGGIALSLSRTRRQGYHAVVVVLLIAMTIVEMVERF